MALTALGVGLALFVVGSLFATSVEAAKGGQGPHATGGGGGHGKTTWTGSFSLIQLTPHEDGQLHHGDEITFEATTNATYYFATVSCATDSGGSFMQEVGLYPSWPWSTTITLDHWYYWPAGGADCSAELWATNSKGTKRETLDTMSFVVLP